jgi:probable phosphoglycerate mutase
MSEIRKIYLVRHCEPVLPNKTPICIGVSDIPLSETGRLQAVDLRNYFSNISYSAIYSSPLRRAKETAKIISNGKFKVEIKDNFAEFNIGKWDGMSFAEIKEKYPIEYEERGKDLENYIVDGGESMAMCRVRSLGELWKTICESRGDIIVVAHAGVNRTILSSILNIHIKESFAFKHEYGSINVLIYRDEELYVEEIGLNVSKLLKDEVENYYE